MGTSSVFERLIATAHASDHYRAKGEPMDVLHAVSVANNANLLADQSANVVCAGLDLGTIVGLAVPQRVATVGPWHWRGRRYSVRTVVRVTSSVDLHLQVIVTGSPSATPDPSTDGTLIASTGGSPSWVESLPLVRPSNPARTWINGERVDLVQAQVWIETAGAVDLVIGHMAEYYDG
jgi:hypothetical protein